MNPVYAAREAAHAAIAALAGESVQYDDGEDLVDVSGEAVVGRTNFKTSSEQNWHHIERAVDWIIPAASLPGITPADGHRIRRTIGDTIHVYEVLPFGDEASWRWTDEGTRTHYRIHTKHIDEEPIE